MELIKNTDIDFSQAIVLDAHLLKTFRACEQKFNWFEMQHIISGQTKAAPSFGIAMHEGIAAFRLAKKDGQPFQQALERGALMLMAAYRKNMPPDSQSEVMIDDKRSLDNAMRIFEGYCKHYEPMGLKFHYVEVPFALHLGSCHSKDVIYVGIIDAVLEQHNTMYVNDLKSTGWNIDEKWLEGFRMDQGLLGYTIAARELLGVDTHKAIVHGIWVQKEAKTGRGKPLDEYFRTKEIFWDDTQIAEWHANTLKTVERIEQAKKENQWIMDFGQNCGAFGGCDYRALCSAPPALRPKLIEMDFKRAIWSPLEDERLQKLEG